MAVGNVADGGLINFLAYRAGWIVMRHHSDTGLWHFVAWGGSNALKVEHLGGGTGGITYTYQIWMYKGRSTLFERIEINDVSTLAIVGVKK